MMARGEFGRWHLERANIDHFGKLHDDSVGPFAPGMNVVFGKNESGKTSLSMFIDGVLFGWADGRSHKNTYRPANAERSGNLIFRANDGSEARIARTHNAEIEDEQGLLADIDADTYRTVFALDGDELLSLGDTEQVTSQLLTAGAGTVVSPASALQEVDKQLAKCLSRAAAETDSMPNLSRELKETDAVLATAREKAESLIAERTEYEQIAPRRAELSQEIDELNALIEGRTADFSLLQNTETQIADLANQRVPLAEELEYERSLLQDISGTYGVVATSDGAAGAVGAGAAAGAAGAAAVNASAMSSFADASGYDEDFAALCSLTADEERNMRDTLDDFQTERDRLVATVTHAKDALSASRARYETLSSRTDEEGKRDHRSRSIGQAVLSFVLPAVALLAGIPTTLYGYGIGSLTITFFGLFLVAAALVMGAAALVVALKPDKDETPIAQRVEDARWVMLQDEKKLADRESELAELDEQIQYYFRFNHLARAGQSLRRARHLLDDAREARGHRESRQQYCQSLEVQLKDLDDRIGAAQQQCAELLADAGVGDASAFEALVAEATEHRRSLNAEAERLDTRSGELAQRLQSGAQDEEFAALKQKRASLSCRLATSRERYATLLLARRNLASAIEQWEHESQPSVYRQASSLLAHMTGGAWTQVRLTAAGDVEVVDAHGNTRDPLLLSLGTRQQLYLSLRIALLMTAQNVGYAVPVLADDILVHFDSDRRRSAAEALLRLAQSRQVILFTCHEEILELLRELDSDVCEINLNER